MFFRLPADLYQKTMCSKNTCYYHYIYYVFLWKQFLIERNYPRDVKPKSLQTPSTKEFLYILNVSVYIYI